MNLRLMTSTVRTTTATEAPAEMSGIAANWAAPAATNTDIPSASTGENPLPAAVAPKASPKGRRASNTGKIAFAPAKKAAIAGDADGAVFGRWILSSLFVVVVICDPPMLMRREDPGPPPLAAAS